VPCTAKWNRFVVSNREEEGDDSQTLADAQPEAADPVPPLPESLRNIAAASSNHQQFVLNRVRLAIEIGSLKPQDVSWLAEESGWFDDVFRLLPLDLLRMLGDSLLGLIRVADEEWKVKVPHLLRVQAERRDLDVERRFQAATMVLYASAIVGRVGALVAMVDALAGDELREKMEAWHTRLNEIRESAPASIQGRLRDILAHLPPSDESEPVGASADCS
jgi:hypothetical protein